MLLNKNFKKLIFINFDNYVGINLACYTIYGITTYHWYFALTVTEMSIMKCLYLWKWHRMAMVDDDFLSGFLINFNKIFCFLPIMARIILNEPESNPHLHYATLKKPKFQVFKVHFS